MQYAQNDTSGDVDDASSNITASRAIPALSGVGATATCFRMLSTIDVVD